MIQAVFFEGMYAYQAAWYLPSNLANRDLGFSKLKQPIQVADLVTRHNGE